MLKCAGAIPVRRARRSRPAEVNARRLVTNLGRTLQREALSGSQCTDSRPSLPLQVRNGLTGRDCVDMVEATPGEASEGAHWPFGFQTGTGPSASEGALALRSPKWPCWPFGLRRGAGACSSVMLRDCAGCNGNGQSPLHAVVLLPGACRHACTKRLGYTCSLKTGLHLQP